MTWPLAGCPVADSRTEPEVDAGVSAGADAGDDGPVCAPDPPVFTADPACAAAGASVLDAALGLVGLDRCSLGYHADDWDIYPTDLTDDPYRLPWFNAVHDQPTNLPRFGRVLAQALDAAQAGATPIAAALGVQSFAFGGTQAPCIEPFTLDDAAPLARAVADLIRAAGVEPDEATIRADADDVPLELQRATAQLVLAAAEANATFEALLAGFPAEILATLGATHHYWLYSLVDMPDFSDPRTTAFLARRLDMVELLRGATTLALRVEHLDLAPFAGMSGFDFEQATPLGRVVITDGGAQVHAAGEHVLLLLDTGGDDTYLGAVGAVDASEASASTAHVGLAIDLAGDDTYTYEEVPDAQDGHLLPSDQDGRFHPTGPRSETVGPVSLSQRLRQGGARLGYGMLLDLGSGRDTYRSLRFSQGYGEAGVGVLYDQGGDDTYTAEAASQGAAFFGAGLLLDGGGDDTYRAFSLVQGFAGVRAVGILHDAAGADRYLVDNGDPADGGDPLYWSIQIPGRSNNSFSQGAAWGVRCDGDQACMSGGLGVLRDLAGDDVYVASVQAQASGYWFGTGILSDGGGRDTYDARYYVQGAGAHFALALFVDADGDDRYNTSFDPRATSIGVGHDYTVAMHLDLGGDDEYHAPQLSLGSGNANGIGVLLNVGGDDSYRAPAEPSLGAASLSQEWYDACVACRTIPTTGVFIDIGGADTYDVSDSDIARGNGVSWINRRSPAEFQAIEHGVGLDADEGELLLP